MSSWAQWATSRRVSRPTELPRRRQCFEAGVEDGAQGADGRTREAAPRASLPTSTAPYVVGVHQPICLPPLTHSALSPPTAADFDVYAPWELYEKYESNPRLVGYCTKDDPCSEITADAAAGAPHAPAQRAAVGRGRAGAGAASQARRTWRPHPAPSPVFAPTAPRRAALAAASELLKGDNPAWAAKALQHAKQLYAFASEYPGSYQDSKDDAIIVSQGQCDCVPVAPSAFGQRCFVVLCPSCGAPLPVCRGMRPAAAARERTPQPVHCRETVPTHHAPLPPTTSRSTTAGCTSPRGTRMSWLTPPPCCTTPRVRLGSTAAPVAGGGGCHAARAVVACAAPCVPGPASIRHTLTPATLLTIMPQARSSTRRMPPSGSRTYPSRRPRSWASSSPSPPSSWPRWGLAQGPPCPVACSPRRAACARTVARARSLPASAAGVPQVGPPAHPRLHSHSCLSVPQLDPSNKMYRTAAEKFFNSVRGMHAWAASAQLDTLLAWPATPLPPALPRPAVADLLPPPRRCLP